MSNSSPIDLRKRSEQVEELVLNLIRERSLKPGDKLPSEPELMRLFNVGRSSVRTAMTSLVALGLVEIRPGCGAYLREASFDDILQKYGCNLVSMRPSSLLQIYEALNMLDIVCASLAAQRRSLEDLGRMAAALQETQLALQDNDINRLVEADLAFHEAVAAATGNEVLLAMRKAANPFLRAYLQELIAAREPKQILLTEHERVYFAIVKSNAAEARALTEQCMLGVRHLFEIRSQGADNTNESGKEPT